MRKLIKIIAGDPASKKLKGLRKQVDEINALTEVMAEKTDKELRARIDEIKHEIRSGKTDVDEVLHEVFAITREMSERVLGMRHFDVQLIGGMVLHNGDVAEMRTGEGKTLVATLAVVLNALKGEGVHVVTVNDYLARRDAGWMGQLYHALGLSVGVIMADNSMIYNPDYTDDSQGDERLNHHEPCTRQEAYKADVTYGTNNEFGFDYLRDNMVSRPEDLRQRPLSYAIVDEVDSILIDEARTPLIISAPASSSSSQYEAFSKAVKKLKPEHYEKDEKQRSVILTDSGIERIQEILGIDNVYNPEHVQAVYHLDQALRAEVLFKKDKDYVVHEGEVVIVDEFTGRLMHGRRYSEGLHQAIEAKEGVSVLQESMTLATISFQNFFRLYDKLSGMTGTAETEKEEFYTIYKLDVVVIPTNVPTQREDLPDRIYSNEAAKFKAIVREVGQRSEAGQPVLIGTASVEKNELLSQLLRRANINHEVLNAKNNQGEASIVAQAGQAGAVTLATNIAGRGTDIVLGEGVVDAGGLYVLGTERHESRRIDNQLRGRAGRQGDPGATQFYVSADDDIMRVFGGDRLKNLMDRLGVNDETPIENKTITKALENAQKKVEEFNYDRRKNVVKYDDVMNRHRKATYSLRKQILMSEDITDLVKELLEDEITFLAHQEHLKPKERVDEFAGIVPISQDDRKKMLQGADDDKLEERMLKFARAQYENRRKAYGDDVVKLMERHIYLKMLDDLWMQHLENMQHLREGIGWRSVGQRDPLVEYRREGQVFYDQMLNDLRMGVLRLLFRSVPRTQKPEAETEVETELTRAAANATSGGGGDESKSQAKRRKRTRSINSSQNNSKPRKKPKSRKAQRAKRKKKK